MFLDWCKHRCLVSARLRPPDDVLSAADVKKEDAERLKVKQRVRQLAVYRGSPQCLLFIKEFLKDWRSTLRPVPGGAVFVSVYLMPKLEAISHLFPEHVAMGASDTLAGMVAVDTVAGPDAAAASSQLVLRPFTWPEQVWAPGCFAAVSQLPSFHLTLSQLRVRFPTDGFDDRMVDTIRRARESTWGAKSLGVGRIISRSLRVGLHNGRGFIRPPVVLALRPVDTSVPAIDPHAPPPPAHAPHGPVRDVSRFAQAAPRNGWDWETDSSVDVTTTGFLHQVRMLAYMGPFNV